MVVLRATVRAVAMATLKAAAATEMLKEVVVMASLRVAVEMAGMEMDLVAMATMPLGTAATAGAMAAAMTDAACPLARAAVRAGRRA